MQTHCSQVSWSVKLALLIVVILWASAFIGIRVGLEAYSPGSLALLRYIVASATMLLIYFCAKKQRKQRQLARQTTWRDYILAAICGALGFTIYNVTLNLGEVTTSAGISSFIVAQVPLLTIIGASYFLKEKLRASHKIGLLISFCGIVVILFGQYRGAHFNFGLIDIAVATIAMCAYNILQKPLLSRLSALEFTCIAMCSGTLMMLFYLPSLIHEIQAAPILITLDVVYMGIFPAAIAYFLWSYALSRAPTSYSAFYFYCIPVVTTIMGMVLLKEELSLYSFVGGLIALAGVVWAQSKSAVKTTAIEHH